MTCRRCDPTSLWREVRRQPWRARVPALIAAAMLALCVAATQAVAAQKDAPNSARNSARFDAIAKLLAGIAPPSGPYQRFARSAAWKEHSRLIQASWSRVRDGQGAAMVAWRKAEIPHGCPAGHTVLYPFSGPDFLNVHWLFPDCGKVVMFGLERVGAVPDVEAMSSVQFAELLAGLRSFMVNLFVRNYFVTRTMLKGLRHHKLQGLVPVFMASMALSGVEVLSVEPTDFQSQTGLDGKAGTKGKIYGVRIEFRRSDSAPVQQMTYFSLDVSDAGIARHPQFIDYLTALAPTTTLIKSASYLLRSPEFSRVRKAIMTTSAFILQDDSGVPYSRLLERGWHVRLYGVYEKPLPVFAYAYQRDLAAAYAKQKPKALGFRFGYQSSRHDNRSNLMIARSPTR